MLQLTGLLAVDEEESILLVAFPCFALATFGGSSRSDVLKRDQQSSAAGRAREDSEASVQPTGAGK